MSITSARLIFIGARTFVANLMGLDKFPQILSLSVTFAILAAGVSYSLWIARGAGVVAGSAQRGGQA